MPKLNMIKKSNYETSSPALKDNFLKIQNSVSKDKENLSSQSTNFNPISPGIKLNLENLNKDLK